MNDGGFLVSGYRNTPSGRGLLLLRNDSAGNQKWLKTYGGPWDAWGGYLAAASDGNFLFSGSVRTDEHNWKVYVMKVDPSGNKIWNHYYGDFLPFQGEFHNIIPTANNTFTIMGGYRNQSTNRDVGWLVKIDSAGN